MFSDYFEGDIQVFGTLRFSPEAAGKTVTYDAETLAVVGQPFVLTAPGVAVVTLPPVM